MSAPQCRLLVCGGGNGAHVLAGLAAADADTDARVLTLYADEAERWSESMTKHDFTLHFDIHGKEVQRLKNKPEAVTKDPSVAADRNLIVLVVPAFAHAQYLRAIAPHVTAGTTLIGMPGQAGFELDVRGALGIAKTAECTLISFESLPWACRVREYGRDVEVLGTKALLSGAVQHSRISSTLKDPVATLQRIVGELPVLAISGHILGMTLMGVNAYVHPAILYGRWKNHTDGDEGLDEAPLFYQGLDEHAADVLSKLSDEVLATAAAVTAVYPDVDMSNVEHIFDWYIKCYGGEISDRSCLYHAITTNDAYIGLTHPMKKKESATNDNADGKKLVPDFGHRYFTEDVPYGLAVLRGLAEVAEVSTPTMDEVLLWMQSKMGREYLKEGTISGGDVDGSRAPQRYGFHTLDAVLGKH